MPFTLVLVPGIELFAITEFHVRWRRLNCEFLNLEKYSLYVCEAQSSC